MKGIYLSRFTVEGLCPLEVGWHIAYTELQAERQASDRLSKIYPDRLITPIEIVRIPDEMIKEIYESWGK